MHGSEHVADDQVLKTAGAGNLHAESCSSVVF